MLMFYYLLVYNKNIQKKKNTYNPNLNYLSKNIKYKYHSNKYQF